MRKYLVSFGMMMLLFIIVLPTFAITYTGRLQAGDTTMDGRIFRDSNPSTCGITKAFPGNFSIGETVYYETFAYTNTNDKAVCINVTILSDDGNVHTMAYLGSFDPTPAGRGNNFIGDSGSSSTFGIPRGFSFALDAGATAIIVVNTNNDALEGNYVLTISESPVRVDDGRINDDNNASYVIYADGNGGLIFLTPSGETIFSVSANEIAQIPSLPSATTLIKEFNNIRLYRLTDGTFQAVGPNLHGDKTYVVRFATATANAPYSSYEE